MQGRGVEATHTTDTGGDLMDDFVALIAGMAMRLYGRRHSNWRVAQFQACMKRCVEAAEQVDTR
jgi:predicted site-specific integrase-resolvase